VQNECVSVEDYFATAREVGITHVASMRCTTSRIVREMLLILRLEWKSLCSTWNKNPGFKATSKLLQVLQCST